MEFNYENNNIPVLPNGVKNYLIDIDGTITDDVPNENPEAMKTCLPYEGSADIINNWYDNGHIITFFTSRTEDLREITEEWLNKHNYKFHGLLMGKPRGGRYHVIDNHMVKATRFKGKWGELIEKIHTIEVFP